MFIFDNFVSDELAAYATEARIPVLDNAFARDTASRFNLNLLAPENFAAEASQGRRLITVSENSLDWVVKNVQNPGLIATVKLMKDKHALRQALHSLYPAYFFRQVPAGELAKLDISSIPMPFVLKPSIGFYSVGVYTIDTPADWSRAISEIAANLETWKRDYPASVLGEESFLLEELIEGEEFAVDVYFDAAGVPVILNVLQHEFASEQDVSDRFYYTSKELVERYLPLFDDYFTRFNRIVGARDFPAHIELRIRADGTIIPIECNPLRFAGWGTSDLPRFALGLNSHDYFLHNRKPDWNTLFAGKGGMLYWFAILDKPAGTYMNPSAQFDHRAVQARFPHILHYRPMLKPEYPMFGFIFAETPATDQDELDYIIHTDLTEYVLS